MVGKVDTKGGMSIDYVVLFQQVRESNQNVESRLLAVPSSLFRFVILS